MSEDHTRKLTTEELNNLLQLQELYASESLEALSSGQERSEAHNSGRPSTSGKHMSSLRPAGYNSVPMLMLTRSDGILVRLYCPVCSSSAFHDVDEFIWHLKQTEEIPIFEDQVELELIRVDTDLLALEFGTVADSGQQSATSNLRMRRMIERGLDPNTDIYVRSVMESADPDDLDEYDMFKYLRRKLPDGGQTFDQLLKEVKET